MGFDEACIAFAPADAIAAGFLPVTVPGDHIHIKPHQWANVAIALAVGAQDFHHLPGGGDACRDLTHTRILGARISVDLLQQLYLGVKSGLAERINVAIKLAVGAAGWLGIFATMPALDRAHRLGGADRKSVV